MTTREVVALFPTAQGSESDRSGVVMDIDGFLQWCASWGAARQTIRTRGKILRAYERDTAGSDDPADLEAWAFRSELAAWSRASYRGALKAYFAWEVHAGRRDGNPVDRVRRSPRVRSTPRPFSPREVRTILSAPMGHRHLRAWLLLGLFAGLRVHETAKLRGEDFDGDTLFVCGKGGQEAFLPVHDRIAELAADYPATGAWFPGRAKGSTIKPDVISAATSRHLRVLGITGSYHRCRHTYGTALLRSGASLRTVQELMRHESVTSTQIYTQVTDSERVRAINRLVA